MKRIISFILFALALQFAGAQEINFKLSAPSAVVKGQQFRVTYTLNEEGRQFRAGSFGDLEVLAGPSTSSSSSVQYINGSMSSETTTTYTYILMASSEGTFTIPAATVKAKGSNYTSNQASVKVLPEDKKGATSNQDQNSEGGGSTISGDKIFLRVFLSKSAPFQGEAVVMTVKLYTQYNIVGISDAKFPDLDGFFTQEIQLPQEKEVSLENYNGSNYQTVVVKKALLFPQRSGKITIPSHRLECVLRMASRQRRSRSFFDDFFDSYQDVKKVVTSNPTSINVKGLPEGKPASFDGTVGNINLTAKISKEQLKANESVTITLTYSGNGNLKLIKTPAVQFPADFELYDPKVTNNFKTTSAGMSGTKSIEYLAIPRFAGEFTIPGVEFSYLDVATGKYKTIRTQDFKLKVAKGSGGDSSASTVVGGNYTNKEDVKFLGKDIRYIKSGDLQLVKGGTYFFKSTGYLLGFLLPAILFIVLAFIYRKRAIENANVALQRTKKANKVAIKRLKTAATHLQQGKTTAFYDELLNALWGYLSDKLALPLSELSKENVVSELAKYGADESVIEEFISILNTCEYARYAPVSGDNPMGQLYDKATHAIGQLEATIKTK